MPEQITETGATYSRAVGLIYIFNLIVGTGALTMPNAFSTSGWLLSLITVILLAIISYLTVTFVTETMAIANAKIKIGQRIAVNMVNESYEDETSEKEPLLGNSSTEIFNNSVSDFEITERVELGQMAALFFNRVGIFLFYLCMVLYLYGDLAIYAAAVPKSLRDVICTYTLPSNVSCNRTLGERDICWNSHGTSRLQAYRIMVAVFIVCLGPFTFFNVQKTKYLQIFTTITRWLVGIFLFYLCMVLYLYGDLAIYAAAVPKSLRDVICTYTLPSNVSCNRTLGERDICWNSHGTSRLQAYRIMVAVFIVCLGPFTFFNVQKTKYLQIFTTITRWLVGIFLFYLCMVLYLYGDLAIYAAAVPKSLRDVICTYTLPSNVSCNRTLGERDICWNSHGTSRLQAYRIMVAVFIVCLGPFTFFNVQKTKYLQIFTTITRWLAFILMIVLAAIRLEKGQGTGHPVVADFSGIPNLFGVCIYSFMCHHSLPSLITPIRNKKGLYGLIFSDFTLILGFYALISFTGIYSFSHLKDLYTLNFLPDDCDPSRSVTNVKFFEYFLALFPVFTLSTNFPIISVTLRNNLKTMFYNEERPYSWFVDKIVFPVAAITPPVIVAIITNEVEFLVGITGSYAGAGIQYVIPAILVYCARKEVTNFSPGHVNPLKSPFKHVAWVIFVLIWACICIIFVTVNHIINKK